MATLYFLMESGVEQIADKKINDFKRNKKRLEEISLLAF
jgi:hypothetical protein